jgi:glycosyltransferase involved in cell wall biosynthesis
MAEPIHVSIVVPAYNAAETITQTLSSALQQTEPNLEVLVVDDASTDTTAGIAAQVAARDKRVRLLRQTVNRGPAAARNRGMASARGKWIALLDADDAFAPARLEVLTAAADRHAADLVADNLLLCPEQGGEAGTPMIAPDLLPQPKMLSAAEFVAGNIGSRYTPRVSYGFLQPLIRRAFLQRHGIRYDERNRFGEDFVFALTCLLKGARWWLTPEAMYHYTVRAGSLTDVQSAGDLLRIRTLEEDLLRRDPVVASDPELARALRRHKTKIEHFYFYRAFTDAVKAGTAASALNLVLNSPRSLRHIVTESAMQAPRILLKALRGGYHRPHPSVLALAGAGMRGETRTEA